MRKKNKHSNFGALNIGELIQDNLKSDKGFGNPHHNVIDWYHFGSETYLLAQHTERGKVAFFSKEGETKIFGGPHAHIVDYAHVYGIDYIIALHDKKKKSRMYEIDGSISRAFGGPHKFIEEFKDFDGYTMLYARDSEDTRFTLYTHKGVGFEDDAAFREVVPYLKMLEPYNLFDEYVGVKVAIDNFLVSSQGEVFFRDKEAVKSALDSSMNNIIERHNGNADMQRQELAKLFNALDKALVEKPEKLMEAMNSYGPS